MDSVRNSLRRIAVGFVYGVGVALGMLAVLLASTMATFRCPDSDPVVASAGLSHSAQHAIEIVSSEAILPPWYVKIIGELRNAGHSPARGGHIIADLYDNEGQFYFQCKTLMLETIAPGTTTTFSIDCHGLTRDLWERYGSYSIRTAP